MKPAIIVHGGAWDIPDSKVEAHIKGCHTAVEQGWTVLDEGGSAIDAVQSSVVSLEDNPTFDAGRGAFLNIEGEVELDAMIMDGTTLDVGAVAAVKDIRNPVLLARKVMDASEHVLLVGEGARKFAEIVGTCTCRTEDLLVGRELHRYQKLKEDKAFKTRSVFEDTKRGTVGAVAIDSKGKLAAATSTGGTPKKLSGRVGDSAIVGCGTYADNTLGAVSATGWGETIMKVVLAKTICDLMGLGFDSKSAIKEGIAILGNRVNGLGGAIGISPQGVVGWAFNTPKMAYAYKQSEQEIITGI